MTLAEVLAAVDELKPNAIDDNMKIQWISEIDGKVFQEIINTHEDASITEFNGYTSADMDTTLLVPYPYDDVYQNYLFAMIDYTNGEIDRYQNSVIMFNSKFQKYMNWYNKNHLPKSSYLKF